MNYIIQFVQVHQALGLDALKNRTFQIFKASAIRGDGLDESMEWLSNSLQVDNDIQILEKQNYVPPYFFDVDK